MAENLICSGCASIGSLENYIRDNGEISVCSYCGNDEVYVLQRDTMFKYIKSKLEELLTPLSSYPRLEGHFYYASEDIAVYSDGYDFFQYYEEFFNQTFFSELLDNIRDVFNETLITLEDSFRHPGDACSSHTLRWPIFVNKLNHEYRYLNREFISLIETILSPLVENGNLVEKYITSIDQKTALYRGRIFNNNKEKEDIKRASYSQIWCMANQAASCSTLIPSLNFTPSMTSANRL